ncbi:30S ribosome-binding factor RbfA [Oleisolibacter albus]|uniref:30S ribosome-binding factor RbfA n=1 Tax=Oleisolibacter albus TaxID=2171757 RepID=UPI000DF1A4A3|nr:30S ribosome-binding factor RbfA [Oleisolibacter albus]
MTRKHSGGSTAKGPSQRQLRVGEEIRHALADIFRRGEFRDPALQDLNITVTEVRISPDLKNATAFIMPLGGGHAELIPALNRASAFLRSQVAQEVRLPYAPRVSFQMDTSFDYASKIDRILHDPQVARDLDAEGMALNRDALLPADDADGADADAADAAGEAAGEDEGDRDDSRDGGRHGA